MAEEGTITLRCIRSFEHRNVKNIVVHKVDLNQTTAEFLECIKLKVKSAPGFPPPLRNYQYDTFKIEQQAHGFKTNDPVINREDDDKLILQLEKTLLDSGVKHETDISFFKMEDYLKYKENPVFLTNN